MKRAFLAISCGLCFLLYNATAVHAQAHARLGAPVVGPGEEVVPEKPPLRVNWRLEDLVQIGLDQNPALRQAGLNVEAARGLAIQAGLYPNPMVSVIGDELGGTNGQQGGIITAPMVSQEFVTAGKKKLDRTIGERKTDQASLMLTMQRYELLTAIRSGFYETLTAQQRVATLEQIEKIAKRSYDLTKILVEVAKTTSTLDLLQVQIELNRVQAELEAARREQTAAWRKLTAVIGAPGLTQLSLDARLEDPLPLVDYDRAAGFVIENHPAVGLARVGIDAAELMLRRQKVEPIPNVTFAAGYVRDNQEKMDLWMFQVGMPVPLFNRNQGNILNASAELGKAVQQVPRAQNELIGRLAAAFGMYQAAKERVDRYRKTILPAASQANKIALDAFKGGQFEYLRVLQAQRVYQDANLEYVRALGEAWKAASEIAGLLLAEEMPRSVVEKK